VQNPPYKYSPAVKRPLHVMRINWDPLSQRIEPRLDFYQAIRTTLLQGTITAQPIAIMTRIRCIRNVCHRSLEWVKSISLCTLLYGATTEIPEGVNTWKHGCDSLRKSWTRRSLTKRVSFSSQTVGQSSAMLQQCSLHSTICSLEY
jgi:hypothetical protein